MENIQKWWAVCLDNRDELTQLVAMWHPASAAFDKMDIDMVTAPGAEKACDVVRDSIKKQHEDTENIVGWFIQALDKKDFTAVIDTLQQVWFGAPEHVGVHNVPGFGVLCDLLEGPG